jgi:hypothetical protein
MKVYASSTFVDCVHTGATASLDGAAVRPDSNGEVASQLIVMKRVTSHGISGSEGLLC